MTLHTAAKKCKIPALSIVKVSLTAMFIAPIPTRPACTYRLDQVTLMIAGTFME